MALLLACLASSYLASPAEQPSERPFAASCEASVASCWAFVLLLLLRLASGEGCLVSRMLAFACAFESVLVLGVAGRACLGIGLGLGLA